MFDELTDFLQQLNRQGVPGLAMTLWCKGKTLYDHREGWQDREKGIPLGENALFQVYSAVKPVTAAAALTLYEKGKFSMEDPVSRYIPEFAALTVQDPDGRIRPARSPMTVGQLFSMTSGIRYDLAKPAIQKTVAETAGRAPTVAVAKAIASAPLAFDPGSGFCYSLSSDVLAAVVEVIAGVPFREYVQSSIFAPCGMESACFHLPADTLPRQVTQYRLDAAQGKILPLLRENEFVFGSEYDSGGAGLCCSLEDLARFCRMLARKGKADSGARVLLPETVERMRQNRLNEKQLADFKKLGFSGYGYGLSVRTMVRPGQGLSPKGEFGWYGAAGAYLLMDPDNEVVICYCQQVRGMPMGDIHSKLRDLSYQCLMQNGLI